jgi:putative acyl-CoA dehydrogenase
MRAPPIVAATHEVANQPPPLENINLFEQDGALRAAVLREGGAWGEARLGRFGTWLGEAATLRLGE